MKVEDLKLYNKYKDIREPNRILIYIGIDHEDDYIFLYKNENVEITCLTLKLLGFNPDKIAEDLNLEIIDGSGNKYIKKIIWTHHTKKSIEQYVKPLLKDKLKNIINR